MVVDNLEQYKTVRVFDDYLTRIEFLEQSESQMCKRIVRKTVKDADQGVPLAILCEIAIYRLLQEYRMEWVAPQFLGYKLGTFEDFPSVYMEAASCDLEHFIAENAQNPVKRMKYLDKVIKDSTLCVAACHSLGLIYADPKPSNFLVYKTDDDEVARISLCDFGYTSPYGLTLYDDDYRPPEVWKSKKATHKGDIWALGLTLLKYIWGNPVIISNNHQTSKFLLSQRDFCLTNGMLEKLDERIFIPACYENNNFEINKLHNYHNRLQQIFMMLRFVPEQRELIQYTEIVSFPNLEVSVCESRSPSMFAQLLLDRCGLHETRYKVAAEMIAQKWYFGECDFINMAAENYLSQENLENSEKEIIEKLDGLIYLPS